MNNDLESIIAFIVCLLITGPVGFLILAAARWAAGLFIKGDK